MIIFCVQLLVAVSREERDYVLPQTQHLSGNCLGGSASFTIFKSKVDSQVQSHGVDDDDDNSSEHNATILQEVSYACTVTLQADEFQDPRNSF